MDNKSYTDVLYSLRQSGLVWVLFNHLLLTCECVIVCDVSVRACVTVTVVLLCVPARLHECAYKKVRE